MLPLEYNRGPPLYKIFTINPRLQLIIYHLGINQERDIAKVGFKIQLADTMGTTFLKHYIKANQKPQEPTTRPN